MPSIERKGRSRPPKSTPTRDRDRDQPDNKIPTRPSDKPQRLPQHDDHLHPNLRASRTSRLITPLPHTSSFPSSGNLANQARRSPLTREALRALDSENKPSRPSPVNPEVHMRKSKKTEKKKLKKEKVSHPLNLPPDELRSLSAAMAEADANGSTMDIDQPEQPSSPKKNSPPTTPFQSAPGAFPDSAANGETNGVNGHEDEKSPTPPPHNEPPPPPPVDAEACKAAGNKFFKAKDYSRAIAEYTKGRHSLFIWLQYR